MGDFGDFIGQLPPIIPILFCGFGLLLLISFGVMAANRTRKNAFSSSERQREKADWLSSVDSASVLMPPSSVSAADLPDLDLLLRSEPEPAYSSAQPATNRQPGTQRLKLADGSSVEAADVLVIARDLADGSLIVQLGNKAYPLGAYIDDPDARRRFTGTLRDLLAQGETMTTAPAAPVLPATEPEPIIEEVVEEIATVIEAPVETSEPIETAPEPEPPAKPTSTATATSPQVPRGQLPGDLPKFKMEDAPLKMRGGMPKEPVPELNIGGAVEAYLQYKLSQSPEFAKRTIHIHPAYGGGIKIEVDGRFYEAVDEIDDAATRDFITEAIQEWQSRQ